MEDSELGEKELNILNTYTGNIVEGVSKINQRIFTKLVKLGFLSKEELYEQFEQKVEQIAEETREEVFWTVSQGSFKMKKVSLYSAPTGWLAGFPVPYIFSLEKMKEAFFRGTNAFAFKNEKKDNEMRYAIVGTNDPGRFADNLRKNADKFDGVKYGSYRKIPLNTPEAQENIQSVVDVCQEQEWPMMLHTSVVDYRNNEELEGITMLAESNPGVNFCASHMGGDISKWKGKDYDDQFKKRVDFFNKLKELGGIPKNIFLNTAVTHLEFVKKLMEAVPELKKHILLASDVPHAFETFEAFEAAVKNTFSREEIEQFNENAREYAKEKVEAPEEESVFEELAKMPTPEEVAKGLDDLVLDGIATPLSECSPEEGRPFVTVELDFGDFSPEQKSNFLLNPFVRALAISREKTFCATGEGTGKSFDWEDIDMQVRQTVTFDPEAQMIVSASRMAVPAETEGVETFLKSLYEYNDVFDREVIQKSAELGRTFVNGDYVSFARENGWIKKLKEAFRKSIFQGVLLQFNAILDEGHKLQYLIGVVSSHSGHSDEDQRKIMTFFPKNSPMEQMLPEGAVLFPKYPEHVIDPIESNEQWFTETDDLVAAEKNLRRVTKTPGVNYPVLLPGYTDFSSRVGYGVPVFNPERNGCGELALILDAGYIKDGVEEKFSPQGKNLKEADSVRKKVQNF